MAEANSVTGNAHVDRDLAALLRFGEDGNQLAGARDAIRDDSLSLEQLRKVLPAPVISISLALLDREQAQAFLDAADRHQQRAMVQRAIDLVSQRLAGLDRHPAILAAMRRALAQEPEAREDGENTITGIGWELMWKEDEGSLVPAVRLRLRGESRKVLLVSTMDWDDMSFLVASVCSILERHMEKTKSVSNAKLLLVPESEAIGERLGEALGSLYRVTKLAEGFGIKVVPGLPNTAGNG